MTKLLRFTIPSAAALAVATALGLATAPAQAAAMVTYKGCTSTSFCTLTELINGGSITVDEDGNGTIEKTFANWGNYDFMPSGAGNTLSDPASNIRVSATGTYIPGVSGSATLNYTVVNNALKLAPTLPAGNALSWSAVVDFTFDITSAEYVPITEQIDKLTGAAVVGPTSGVTSYASFNSTTLVSDGTSMMTDTIPLSPPMTTSMIGNTLDLRARRIRIPAASAVVGTSEITSFSQTFTQVVIPEPGTVVGLLVVGGLGLAMKRKQQG
ncbi:PEP-CTERM sorting domain-containing protein [Microcystis flos-aquae FACHB-1344]|uniref:PEP-CTERM sorting domain-containing protein n=1 Tax=Microcystis flos-aquae FACHB-1344 TaxID=2692899 RepID=A0ABR8HQ54_9CHRO|nr:MULTISPECIES: PEP-CTERM sorting domain-containing protein [Microcystis]MBD2620802.1 PEP-CTERM sorting domain-containing protein [Microcystis flos-aquae FACHB-1344]MCA2699268.1 PEP-CTERM sorting domain-containing protein [Microcystis sp. M179S2]